MNILGNMNEFVETNSELDIAIHPVNVISTFFISSNSVKLRLWTASEKLIRLEYLDQEDVIQNNRLEYLDQIQHENQFEH